MNSKTREFIKSDMQRYFDRGRIPLKVRLSMPLEIKYLITFRKAQLSNNKILKKYYNLKLRLIRQKSMIQIPPSAKIGKGFEINHCGRIIINPRVVMGDNITIATGVTIGQTNRGEKQGTPTIGNKVFIGTNAVIIGNIMIGDDVLIAPNAYVNFDVPSHAIVLGNPATIHLRDNATEGYVNRII